MELLKWMALIGITCLLSSCASAQKRQAPVFLSDSFDNLVQQDIHIFPIIDARADKNKDLQDIIGYSGGYDYSVKSSLETKGYTVKNHNNDIRSCPSVSNIKSAQDLTCLNDIEASQLGIILLLSVDEYTRPETMSASGLAYVSGVLIDVKANSIIWKDSIRKGSDDAALLMFGGGGYLGGLLVKALSPNIIYRNDALTSIRMIIQTLPELPAQKRTGTGEVGDIVSEMDL